MRERVIDRSVHQVTEFDSIDDFESRSNIPAGVLTIQHGWPIDVLNQPNGADVTLVFLHGAMKTDVRPPVLYGQRISADLRANKVFISDPTLILSENLLLSWYAGNRLQPDLQSALGRIVRAIARSHGTDRVVIFGGSGGGFAAMHLASEIPASLALVFNPQTDIAKYDRRAVLQFTDDAFDTDPAEYNPLSLLPDSVQLDLCQLYSEPVDATVAYMQNANDTRHIERHMLPFLARAHPSNRVHVLVEAWDEGHTPPPRDLLARALHATTTAASWEEALESLSFARHSARSDQRGGVSL